MSITDQNGTVRHEGRVLAISEENLAHDSYFHAHVWDDDKQKVVTVCYGSTAWSGIDLVTVDAPDELRWTLAAHHARTVAATAHKVEAEVRAEPVKGATVKVVAGRKYIGREGKVFWFGEKQNPYNHRTEVRVGVEDGEGRFFLPASQVQVVSSPMTDEQVTAEVQNRMGRSLAVLLAADWVGIPVTEVWHLVMATA